MSMSEEDLKRQQFHLVKRGLVMAVDRCNTEEDIVAFVEEIVADPKAALKAFVEREIADISDSVKGLNARKTELTAAMNSVDAWEW